MYKTPPVKKIEARESYNGKLDQRLPNESKNSEAEALLMVIDATVHELNQPMTTVLGLSELLLAQAEPQSAQAQDLTLVIEEVRRMSEIVKGLRLLAHYQTKSQPAI